MVEGLRLAIRRHLAVSHLVELSHLATERQLRHELGKDIDRYSRRGLRAGWSSRTTAAILAAIRSGRLARHLDHDRRMRIGRVLSEQDSHEASALEWLAALKDGRLNVVGLDTFVLRYNTTSGLLASWIRRGENVDPHVRPIFIAVSAWALAGLDDAILAERFEELLGGLDDTEPTRVGDLVG